MEILQAAVDDAAEILALQKLAYHSEAMLYDDFGIPPLTQSLRDLRAQFEDHVFLKAVDGGRIVGSVRARCEGGTCHIGRLIVHPDFQNRGIGTKLMHEIEACRPADRYGLFTGSKSERNLYLYAKLGYTQYRTEQQTDKVTIIFFEKRSQ